METSKAFYFPEERLWEVLRKWSEKFNLYAPVTKWKQNPVLKRVTKEDVEKVDLSKRIVSYKLLFLPPVERLFSYSVPGGSFREEVMEQSFVLLGLRACDLRALEVLDKIFLDDPVDIHYRRRREAATLVSVDCTTFWETCFCTRLGYPPYPTGGFDLNFSPVNGGVIMEIGSEKGFVLLEPVVEFGTEVPPEKIDERNRKREEASRKIGQKWEDNLVEKVRERDENFWKRYSLRCVECCACINICPTCYCFSFADKRTEEGFERIRFWEPCLLESYQKVAAGINPRPELHSRLANRVLHKFAYFPERYEIYGCVGCGRCVEACLGKIDIKEPLGYAESVPASSG